MASPGVDGHARRERGGATACTGDRDRASAACDTDADHADSDDTAAVHTRAGNSAAGDPDTDVTRHT
jgi:hypothetical protein